MVILTTACSHTKIRTYFCKCKRMCRRIELRYDIHTKFTITLNHIAHLIFCPENIFTGKIMFVKISVCFNIRFKTESFVCSHCCLGIRIIFKEYVVVIQVQLQVIHLIPQHVFSNFIYNLLREWSSCYVKHETTHFIFRIVTCLTHRDCISCLSKNLQNSSCRPISACGCFRLDLYRFTNIHVISFFFQTFSFFNQCKEEITCICAVCVYNFDCISCYFFVIFRKFCCYCCKSCLVFAVNYDTAVFVDGKISAFCAFPLCKFRYNYRFCIVAFFFFIFSGNYHIICLGVYCVFFIAFFVYAEIHLYCFCNQWFIHGKVTV